MSRCESALNAPRESGVRSTCLIDQHGRGPLDFAEGTAMTFALRGGPDQAESCQIVRDATKRESVLPRTDLLAKGK